MNELIVPVKPCAEDLVLPSYAYPGDAGMDLRSSISLELAPFERALVPCGVAVAIPCGYVGLVAPRSGLAIKHGISIVNSPGIIDSNYRGEIKVVLINLDPSEPFNIEKGDRIAQLVIVPVAACSLKESATLDLTERSDKGFGSSGVGA